MVLRCTETGRSQWRAQMLLNEDLWALGVQKHLSYPSRQLALRAPCILCSLSFRSTPVCHYIQLVQ